MTKQTKRKLIIDGIGILVFAVCLALDLLTKTWAVATKPNLYLTKGIGFTLVYNSGMAFSIFNDSEIAMKIVAAVTVVVMIVIGVIFAVLKPEKRFIKIVLAVIEAGAIGNFIDRIMMFAGVLPGVRDFVDVSFFGFGVCNIADFYVSFGGVALLIYLLFFGSDPIIPIGKRRKQTEKDENKVE